MSQTEKLRSCNVSLLKAFILEAWQLAGPSALGWACATEKNIKEIASDSFLCKLVDDQNLRVFIARAGDKVIGFCALRRMDSQTSELAGIIVHQDHQGKGVGSSLFKVVKQEARAEFYRL